MTHGRPCSRVRTLSAVAPLSRGQTGNVRAVIGSASPCHASANACLQHGCRPTCPARNCACSGAGDDSKRPDAWRTSPVRHPCTTVFTVPFAILSDAPAPDRFCFAWTRLRSIDRPSVSGCVCRSTSRIMRIGVTHADSAIHRPACACQQKAFAYRIIDAKFFMHRPMRCIHATHSNRSRAVRRSREADQHALLSIAREAGAWRRKRGCVPLHTHPRRCVQRRSPCAGEVFCKR